MPTSPEQFDAMKQRTEAAIFRGKAKARQGVVIDPMQCDVTASSMVSEITKLEKIKSKRIKQDTKPLMNLTEARFYATIKDKYPNFPPIRIQAKKFRLCNGVNFTPDFTCSSWPDEAGGPAKETAFEVKGKHAWDDAIVKIKMAAHEWPELNWWFCWEENRVWRWQKILP